MKIRKATADEKDYLAFDELYFRTNYSYEIGAISEERSQDEYSVCPPYTYDEYCEAVITQNHIGDYCLFLEDDQKNIIGCAILDKSPKSSLLEISEFIISRKYQLQGFGKKFYILLENEAKKHGIKTIELYSTSNGSMCFWRKMGFDEDEQNFCKKI